MCLKYAPAKPPSSVSKMLPIMPRCMSETGNPEISQISVPRSLSRSPRISAFVAFCSLFSWGAGLYLPANIIYFSVIITRRRHGPSQWDMYRLNDKIEPPGEIFTGEKVHRKISTLKKLATSPPAPAGVLQEKLGAGVRPASQNSYLIYDQFLRFSRPYLWLDPKSIPCFRPAL